MKYLIDLHCHTITSGHAYSTLQENAIAAANSNLLAMGISDHAPAMPGGAPLIHFLNLNVIPKELNGVRVLKGVEANIIDFKGNLDVPDEYLKKLDYAIASLHIPCITPGTKEENTSAIINAMKNPYIKIIGHPNNSTYDLNYEEVVKAAKNYGVLLEVNNSSLNLNGLSSRPGAWETLRTILSLCEEYSVKIILGSDAHISYDVGNFTNCIKVLQEVQFPEELIINSSIEDIKLLLS